MDFTCSLLQSVPLMNQSHKVLSNKARKRHTSYSVSIEAGYEIFKVPEKE